VKENEHLKELKAKAKEDEILSLKNELKAKENQNLSLRKNSKQKKAKIHH